MRHRHRMPFGAELEPDGRTRFRLWAPACAKVGLVVREDPGRPMQRLADGWFELLVDAPPGTPYRFGIDGALRVPDPASRSNPDDVHGPSGVVDPCAFEWRDDGWRGRPWHESGDLRAARRRRSRPRGTFAAAIERLDYLADLGVTAIELMPVADFAGARNWGYDGVLPFAPATAYGAPDDLKRLVAAAHARGLMVLLDVVYNHFGPEGNYLHAYAPWFFHRHRSTPWGAAINFDGRHARPVRDFFVHNALYWIEEFHFDGLRLDAVHAIADASVPDIVAELAAALRDGPGATRAVHLVLENDRNEARYLERDADGRPLVASAQWNDDVHHALHVLATGENDGYYADYADAPAMRTSGAGSPRASRTRASARPIAATGAAAGATRCRRPRSSTSCRPTTRSATARSANGSARLPTARRSRRRSRACCSPRRCRCSSWARSSARRARSSSSATSHRRSPRRSQAAGARSSQRFARFADPAARASIPDPSDPATFERSRLRWAELEEAPHHRWHAYYRRLLEVRRSEITPRLRGMRPGGTYAVEGHVVQAEWTLGDGSRLRLAANLAPQASRAVAVPAGTALYASAPLAPGTPGVLPPWAVIVTREAAGE